MSKNLIISDEDLQMLKTAEDLQEVLDDFKNAIIDGTGTKSYQREIKKLSTDIADYKGK